MFRLINLSYISTAAIAKRCPGPSLSEAIRSRAAAKSEKVVSGVVAAPFVPVIEGFEGSVEYSGTRVFRVTVTFGSPATLAQRGVLAPVKRSVHLLNMQRVAVAIMTINPPQ